MKFAKIVGKENVRLINIFRDHDIPNSDIEFFFHFYSLPDKFFANVVSQYFEISESYLSGHSDCVTEENAGLKGLENFAEYLLECKHKGYKPSVLFINSDSVRKDLREVTILLELQKISKSGIAFKAYKQCGLFSFSEIHSLCRQAGIQCRGFFIQDMQYQKMCQRLILPIKAIKEATGQWLPDHSETHSDTESSALAAKLRHTAIQATSLTSIFEVLDK